MPALAGGLVVMSSSVLTNAQTYEKIEVSGNQFLRSEDILSVCDISASETFDALSIEEIRGCLMSTGQFADVKFTPRGDTMLIEVDELNKRPGRVEFGLRYDSEEGPVGSFYLERYNLFPGVFGALELSFSDEFRSLTTNFYRADAFSGGWDLGLDMSALQSDFDDQNYRHRRVVIEPYVARSWGEHGKLEIGLGYRKDGILDVAATGSALIRAESGTESAPYLRFAYKYQTAAWSWTAQQHFFGLGTGNVVGATRLSAKWSVPLNGNGLGLTMKFGGGHVDSLKGNAPRITDRFFIGGDMLRGFAPRGIGPRDGRDFLGGETYLTASAEIQKELGQLMGNDARLGGFIDAGSVWGLSNTLGGTVDDSLQWRASVGISLTLDIGQVPLSLYVAAPIAKHAGDDLQRFGLSISARF